MRIAAACLLCCITTAGSADPRSGIAVAVSIAPQKFVVDRIAGGHVAVQVLLPPNAAPESYEPSPRQMAMLVDARAWFRIGVPFERLGPAAGVNAIDTHRLAAYGKDGLDPHYWMSPLTLAEIAGQVRDGLIRVDPAHRREYEDNFRSLKADLEALDRSIHEILSDLRIRDFIIAHASLGHFAKRYGLTQIALEDGDKEAGPRAMAEVIRLAREQRIDTVFIQPQTRSVAAAAVARELGARLVEVDPLAEDYPANMTAIARALAAAMD